MAGRTSGPSWSPATVATAPTLGAASPTLGLEAGSPTLVTGAGREGRQGGASLASLGWPAGGLDPPSAGLPRQGQEVGDMVCSLPVYQVSVCVLCSLLVYHVHVCVSLAMYHIFFVRFLAV